MDLHHKRSINTIFNVIISLLLIGLFLALAYNSYRREQDLILKGAVDTARTISRQIIETRDYLSRNVTSEPEHNPALIPQVAASNVARQITTGSSYYVRQVSLRYRNPDNRPDPYETAQLTRFRDSKADETWQVIGVSGRKQLRYLLPMIADKSCLTCHGSFEAAPHFVQQRFPQGHFSYGYQVGEVIGAVSVAVPMEALYRQIGNNLKRDILYDGVVLTIFIIISVTILRKVVIRPVAEVATRISEVARTGNFTGRIELRHQDEIGDLITSFNSLMTELENKTRQREESEERYRNVIEIAQSPIITFMADGKIVISNQKAEKLFGLTKHELLGQSIFEFMHKGAEFRDAIAASLETGSNDLIGTTTRQMMRDICGRMFEVEMVISVSQSDQQQMFSAILRAARN